MFMSRDWPVLGQGGMVHCAQESPESVTEEREGGGEPVLTTQENEDPDHSTREKSGVSEVMRPRGMQEASEWRMCVMEQWGLDLLARGEGKRGEGAQDVPEGRGHCPAGQEKELRRAQEAAEGMSIHSEGTGGEVRLTTLVVSSMMEWR